MRRGKKIGKTLPAPVQDINLLDDGVSVSPFLMSPPELGKSHSMDLVGESSLDSYSMNEATSINDDNNTISRACHDERVMHIYTDDINVDGDGGTSDAGGKGYDSVSRFQDNYAQC